MDHSRQADVVLEALQAFEGCLGAYASRAVDAVVQIRARFERRCQALRDVEEEAARELDRLRSAYDDTDEGDEAGVSIQAIEDAEKRLAEIRRWIEAAESQKAWFDAQDAAYQDVLSRTIPAARTFLRSRIDELQGYRAVRLDGDHNGDAVVTTRPAPPHEALAGGPAHEPVDSTFRGPLPKGFRWVPLSGIDLARSLDGVAGPDDFKKVRYEAMVEGFQKLRSDILPVLRTNPDGAKDHFREADRRRGHGYPEGLLRVYEAFFGQRDYIYFARRPDRTLDLINGRHRVKVAHDLGWDAVPAQVRE